MLRSGIQPLHCVALWRLLLPKFECDLLFHWESVDCKTASWSAATLQRCEASRISIGLKSCCIGNKGAAGEFVGFLQVIFHHHPSTHSSLRRSGNPLSSCYQSSSVYSVSIHKSIPVDLLFFVLYRKSHTKRVGLVRAIAIDQPTLPLLVAACVDLAFRFSVSKF